MERENWIVIGITAGIIGSFYEFVPRKAIKAMAEFLLFDMNILGHRIRHNDLILFGSIMLIISFVSLYKAYKLMRPKK